MKYTCYLNGHFYAIGDLNYMKELFINYVIDCEMYDNDEVEFKIVKDSNPHEDLIPDRMGRELI